MCGIPQIHATVRSTPSPNPECTNVPYFRRSRYHEYASSGSPSALLRARINAEGLPEDAYSWYLDLRKYGTFVHSGFGLGVERTVAWICGIPHIREAIAFPRTLYRLWP